MVYLLRALFFPWDSLVIESRTHKTRITKTLKKNRRKKTILFSTLVVYHENIGFKSDSCRLNFQIVWSNHTGR